MSVCVWLPWCGNLQPLTADANVLNVKHSTTHTTALTVRENTARTWDFTVAPMLPGAAMTAAAAPAAAPFPGMQIPGAGAGGGAGASAGAGIGGAALPGVGTLMAGVGGVAVGLPHHHPHHPHVPMGHTPQLAGADMHAGGAPMMLPMPGVHMHPGFMPRGLVPPGMPPGMPPGVHMHDASGCVLFLSGFPPTVTCDQIFTLCGTFGVVVRHVCCCGCLVLTLALATQSSLVLWHAMRAHRCA